MSRCRILPGAVIRGIWRGRGGVRTGCGWTGCWGSGGIPKDSEAGRRVFAECLERRREDLRGEFKRVERGWCLGGEEFRRELLEQVDTAPGPSHFGEVVQKAAAVQAERLLIAGLKRMGWSEAGLGARRKGDPKKVDLARELRS